MEKKTTRKNRSGFSKYVVSILLFLLFEAVAITLWLTKNNLFYLLNFSYIGCCLSLGTALFTAGKRYARHFVQLAVGCYMLLYLGVFSRENMQCFSLIHLAPYDAIDAMTTPKMSPEMVQMIREKYGYDQPVYVQYIRWLEGILNGNFGYSRSTL